MNSLVLSHMQYALPVWAPSLYQHNLQRLQSLQNHAVLFMFSLKKFDHVSNYYNLDQLIQFRLVCMMFHQYHYSQSILLKPPIQFGNYTSHFTRTQPHFAILTNADFKLGNFSDILLQHIGIIYR